MLRIPLINLKSVKILILLTNLSIYISIDLIRIIVNYKTNFSELEHGGKKSVQFSEEVEVKTVKREPEIVEVEIDEAKIDRLLHLLHEADPQLDTNDPPEMLELEGNSDVCAVCAC